MLPQGIACRIINQTIESYNLKQTFDCQFCVLSREFIDASVAQLLQIGRAV
jgi:hypothetical protein